jgi:HSP20 family protein
MAMVRFDPFRDLAVLQGHMNRLFNDAYGPRREDDLTSRGTWTPAVDIYEVDGALVLKAEVPDMKREDIEVNLENSTLTIRGERKFDHEIKQESFHRIERAYGSFVRSFSLPNTVDSAKISAEYKNGVLTVKLPVRDDATPRTITVVVAACAPPSTAHPVR